MSDLTTKNIINEKIKVRSAEIVVHGTADKPYYEIKYFDIADGKYHIGYSSYDIHNVFEWLKDCFEIVEENHKTNANATSDLISRSKVYIEMEEFFNDYCNNSTVFDEYDTRIIKIAFEKLFQRFRQIPTACNPDKVVEQLEEFKRENNQEENSGFIDVTIDIVKGGGIDGEKEKQ